MGYDEDLEFLYRNPTRIVFGANTVNEAGIQVGDLGCSKAFLVTDPGVAAAGLAERVEKALGNKLVGKFDTVSQDSGFSLVNEVGNAAKESGADVLVSVGGGSVIDTAKAATIIVKSGGKLEDYSGFQLLSEPQTPHIAIPTTAGTGAEVTYAAVVKDWDRNQKQIIGSDYIIPNVAILDPTLTVGLPPMLTATTGMDAMSHAFEALHVSLHEPITDGLAIHAVRLIAENLPKCIENPGDIVARGQQLVASTIASLAWGNTSTALVHAIAHTLGGLFEVPHGLANSIMLPHAIMYNLDEAAERYVTAAQALGVNTKGMSDEEAGEAAANAIWDLTKKMGVPQKLSEVDVPEDGLEKVADMAMSDAAIVYNIKMILDSAEILDICKKAW